MLAATRSGAVRSRQTHIGKIGDALGMRIVELARARHRRHSVLEDDWGQHERQGLKPFDPTRCTTMDVRQARPERQSPSIEECLSKPPQFSRQKF
ncbi:hypothetical protein FJ942_09315 [Mesorhizobium sp. B2-4-2]|uniref:hypothetical protein n=1 Tax=unclassified Mesorhizobium TaxID=325217 RepID=UPI00116AD7B0|nr:MULTISPECIES: hypothetical protein [unclassified Mesorhizobium]MBZ9956808.1 hypothetical protein [Mesorhizobium sp. BR1-1-14]TPL58855.1 hypothetical protein FJ942_09315 [Mesorhizobium sp. B2-4-2]